jgi:hypothetical protein
MKFKYLIDVVTPAELPVISVQHVHSNFVGIKEVLRILEK